MRTQAQGVRAIHGRIRRRLLVNAVVDPDEAAGFLPRGVRPHVTDGATVVGCCLLEVDQTRPAWAPWAPAARLRAAAHRISAEWVNQLGNREVGVYVPVRHTNSYAARAMGGRVFPGVHRGASVGLADDGRRLTWSIEPHDGATRYGVTVSASLSSAEASIPSEPIGATCLGAAVGISPIDGRLEAARMDTEHSRAQPVEIDHLTSQFLARFLSAQPAPSYLMRDVGVTWTPSSAPSVPAEART